MVRRRKRKQPPVSVPITSMGDIAFLLIFFFMVASNFMKQTKVNPPQAVSLQKLEERAVSVAIDEKGVIFLNGIAVPDAEAVGWGVTALTQKVEDPAQRIVLFKCDKSVKKDVFEPVLDAIAGAGAQIAAVGEELE